MGTLRAHRAQQEPGEAAMAARPEYQQIRALGRVEKTVDGRTMLDIHVDLDSRLPGPDQSFGGLRIELTHARAAFERRALAPARVSGL